MSTRPLSVSTTPSHPTEPHHPTNRTTNPAFRHRRYFVANPRLHNPRPHQQSRQHDHQSGLPDRHDSSVPGVDAGLDGIGTVSGARILRLRQPIAVALRNSTRHHDTMTPPLVTLCYTPCVI